MAKAIHWVIPFQSLKGVDYEIRIYDNYTNTIPSDWPVRLVAGATPIVSSEDNDENIFAPIRPVTGTIEVIDPDGALMEELVPNNNTDRPFILVRRPSAPYVELQGFLSCEAYSQDYNGIAKILDINFNGVLEAMDSIEFDTSIRGRKKIREIIGSIISRVESYTGMTFYYDICLSYTSWQSMNKYIDAACLYDINEQSNEGKTTYEICGLSCKEVLSRICTFLGLTAREYDTYLYLQRVTDEYSVFVVSKNDLVAADMIFESAVSNNKRSISEVNMSDLEYRGDAHQKEIHQGAKSVEVIANISKYNCQCDIPQTMPYTGIYKSPRGVVVDPDVEDRKYADVYISTDIHFDSKSTFRVFHMDEDTMERVWVKEEGTPYDVFTHSFLYGITGIEYNEYVGCMMCRFWNEIDEDDDYEYNAIGLLVTAIDTYAELSEYKRDNSRYIYHTHTIVPLSAESGMLVISPDILYIERIEHRARFATPIQEGDKIYAVIKWGDKYLQDDKSWSTTYHVAKLVYDNAGIRVPIREYNSGEIELFLQPFPIELGQPDPLRPNITKMYEYLVKSFEIEYKPREMVGSDRDSNVYFRFINTNFVEKKSIECDFASDLGNIMSPTMLLEEREGDVMVRTINYVDNLYEALSYEPRRPEIDLLNRMHAYYVKKRRKVDLYIGHLSTHLPMLWIRGDYEDSNILYSPLAVEKDWGKDISVLKCFEIPDFGEWYIDGQVNPEQ